MNWEETLAHAFVEIVFRFVWVLFPSIMIWFCWPKKEMSFGRVFGLCYGVLILALAVADVKEQEDKWAAARKKTAEAKKTP